MAHEYRLITGNDILEFEKAVTSYLVEGWDLWGNPFVSVYPSSDIRVFYQAVVRMAPPVSYVGKLETALTNEPAGFSMQIPETPKVQSTSPLFDGRLCACFEKEGDNLDCPIHYGQPVPNLVY